MKAGFVWSAVLATAVALLPSAPVVASEFGDELERADAMRSSDPKAFAEILARLQASRAAASESERRYLRLLLDYQKTIQGQYEAAIGDAVALFDQASEPELKYRAGLLVANVAAITRDFSLSLRYLERALALQDRIPDAAVRHMGYTVAGSVYNQFGQFRMGLQYADRLLEEEPDPRSRCIAGQIRVEALHGLGQTIDEDRDVQAAIGQCASVREPIPVNLIRSTLAQRWAALGRTQQAIALIEASLPEVEATGYTRLVGEMRSLLAQYRLELGDTDLAEIHARHVAGIKGQDPRWLPNVTARHVLYRVALGRGDFATALSEYRMFAEAEKSRLDDIKAREYAFQLSRHEIAQKNQSIELLSHQNQLLRLQQEVAKQAAWNSRLAMALLAVIALSLGYWGWRGRRMHHTLRQLAQTDSLTGLSNRRHFRAQTEAALASSAQRGRPMSLLLFDLDHFKQINDQCGHAAGDWVLREVARVARLHCREGDVFGRIGGEEFALTLIDCDLEDAERIAEQCRRAIAGIDARDAGCTLAVSASIGCVGTSLSGYEYEVLVAHADAAMYQSKVGGRNRVSLYQPSLLQRAPMAARPSHEAAEVL